MVNGSIVGEGAKITCKCKLKEPRGLWRAGLDHLRHGKVRRFPAFPYRERSGWSGWGKWGKGKS